MTLQPSIFNMFARSPIKPLQEHMAIVDQGTQTLVPFVDALLDKNWEKAASLQETISKFEHDADVLKKDLRLHLPKGLFMPIARGDILELLKAQDSVVNTTEDIAGLMFGRKMQLPDEMAVRFKEFTKSAVSASAQAKKAISELDELFESGFRGSEVELVEAMIHELDRLEQETDKIEIDMRRQLFKLENELPPVEVMFLYKIIEYVGELADRAQQVGSRLQLLLAK